jgi:hypothetical protein
MTDKEYRYLARKICALIRSIPGWGGDMVTTRTALYGRQGAFKLRLTNSFDKDDADL